MKKLDKRKLKLSALMTLICMAIAGAIIGGVYLLSKLPEPYGVVISTVVAVGFLFTFIYSTATEYELNYWKI